MIGVGLAFAFQQTTTTVITKRYYAADTLVGKVGRAVVSMKSTGKGVVQVEHESWSAVAEEDIARGDPIIVTAADAVKETVRGRMDRARAEGRGGGGRRGRRGLGRGRG